MQMNLQKCMPLNSFVGHKSDEIIENVQEHLQNLESCIQDLEELLEHVSIRLIRIRVSVPNILNHKIRNLISTR
ncbi:hypothetical protein ACFX2J_034990 [Malus domestica]